MTSANYDSCQLSAEIPRHTDSADRLDLLFSGRAPDQNDSMESAHDQRRAKCDRSLSL